MGKAESGKKSKMGQTIIASQASKNKKNKPRTQKTQKTVRAHTRHVNRTPKQCKYAAGVISKLILEGLPSTLKTPFGFCKLAFNAGAGVPGVTKSYPIDVCITHPLPLSYEGIGEALDKVVTTSDQRKELYTIIQKFLETPTNGLENKKLCEAIDYINNNVEESDFFKNINNAKSNAKSNAKNDAFNAATTLCGILFISESSPNRTYDGGKLPRGFIRTQISDANKTFKDVLVNFSPFNPKGEKEKGAAILRCLSLGLPLSENMTEIVEEIEAHYSQSSGEESDNPAHKNNTSKKRKRVTNTNDLVDTDLFNAYKANMEKQIKEFNPDQLNQLIDMIKSEISEREKVGKSKRRKKKTGK